MFRKFNFSRFFVIVALCLALLSFASVVLAASPAQEGAQPAQEGAQPSDPEHSISIGIVQCVDPNGAGYIDFTVKSWDFETVGGLNPDIELQYQVKTGNLVSGYVTYMHGEFTDTNHRRFGGTLYLSGNPDIVTLVATALAPWGNGHQPGAMAVKTITLDTCQGNNASPEEPETPRYIVSIPAVYR